MKTALDGTQTNLGTVGTLTNFTAVGNELWVFRSGGVLDIYDLNRNTRPGGGVISGLSADIINSHYDPVADVVYIHTNNDEIHILNRNPFREGYRFLRYTQNVKAFGVYRGNFLFAENAGASAKQKEPSNVHADSVVHTERPDIVFPELSDGSGLFDTSRGLVLSGGGKAFLPTKSFTAALDNPASGKVEFVRVR